MRHSPKTRWILALLLLTVASQLLALAPGVHIPAVILWGVSCACLMGALIIAVLRRREERTKSGR